MGINNTGNLIDVLCAWCGGSGKWKISSGNFVSCVVCAGKGRIKVGNPSQRCQQCNGSGRGNSVNPCLTCAGTGWKNSLQQ